MRIQILTLPSVVVGEDVEEPFALIVDQWPEGISTKDDETWLRFADSCGAKAILATPQTVEVVDRYADPALTEPVESRRSLMDDLPPEVRPLAAAIGIPGRPVDLRERAHEWIAGFLAASDEDRVNCVVLMLGAADDAIRCVVNHKLAESQEEADA
ncbi:hypothetical protein AB0395_39545 [Streptosporangium sp. NPDC051023]|uniref:hypothetical protein n=1 Tax=Streptosporangium sp. NPDC051023 TaxID=3155410 RepID=UPI00344D909D